MLNTIFLAAKCTETFTIWHRKINLKVRHEVRSNDVTGLMAQLGHVANQSMRHDKKKKIQCHLAHGSTFILSRVIKVSVLMSSDDVIWRVRRSATFNCTWFVVYIMTLEWSRIAGFIMDVEKQGEWFTAGNLGLTGSWHDFENKVIAQKLKFIENGHLQTLCREV